MDSPKITFGTRGSDLALAQTRIVSEKLAAAHPALSIATTIIQTTGDKRLDISLSAPGMLEKGLFIKELEDALLQRTVDAAVHSLKDLPTEQPPGLILAAILEREDPSDALVSQFEGGLRGLPEGATVATSSPRRKTQLLHLRKDLNVVDIRGNVPTRLRKLAESTTFAAVLLAQAGLNRLGPSVMPAGLHVSTVKGMLPAPGQGAIAVECREDDHATRELLSVLHHEDTARCVTAERNLLLELGGGCSLPLGALAVIDQYGEVHLQKFLPDSL